MLKASSANFPLKPSETNQRESNLRSYPPSFSLSEKKNASLQVKGKGTFSLSDLCNHY